MIRSIGSQIREARRERGVLQKDLAEAVGVTPEYMSSVESDKKTMSLKTLNDVATMLGKVVKIRFVDR